MSLCEVPDAGWSRVLLDGSRSVTAPATVAVPAAEVPADPMWLVEERERIAAYLKGRVVSKLFSIGIGLQGMLEMARTDQTRRLQRYVDALDAVVVLIRTALFEVPAKVEAGEATFALRLLQLVDEESSLCPFTTGGELQVGGGPRGGTSLRWTARSGQG